MKNTKEEEKEEEEQESEYDVNVGKTVDPAILARLKTLESIHKKP